MRQLTRDRDLFGLGFRHELAGGIASNLDRIDLVEVIAEDLFHAPRRRLDAMRRLGTLVPIVLHGVSLGLASSLAPDRKRLESMARVVNELEPAFWSEHLAFVRAGGVEIGHLAAPPRTPATIDGTARNVALATKIVGARPFVENVATLLDPPGSTLDEGAWLAATLDATGAELLLDLHNLHANAVNFGFDAHATIRRLPADRIASVHLAGGRWIGTPGTPSHRLLDDHLHAVPDEVFALLETLGAHATRPLTVLVERDGKYPPMSVLLAELDRARTALAAGRQRRPS